MSNLLLTLMLIKHSFSNVIPSQKSTNPNIIFVLTDDWGMNDVGWTNDNTEIQTSFLDNLAQTESVIFSNYYVERVCTATRASLFTGRYPSRIGLQSGVFHQNQPFSLTRQVSMLSNEFQSNGYATHIIGKWHLGYQAYEYTPTYRGFDTFYGFWNGGESYYTHKSSIHYDTDTGPPLIANDLYINENPAMDRNGNNMYTNIYGPWWQRDEAINLLKYYAYNKDTKPFFFYFALQASHNPREAPDEYINIYINGQDKGNMDRITYKAQTHTVDDVMKDIITYVKQNGLWDNTLIVFGSDNGGKKTIGDNAPYRGYKNTSWEGGVKVPMFVTGGFLNDDVKGTVNEYSMHITDWYKTLLSAAGLDIKYERSKKLYSSVQMDSKWIHTEELAIDGIDMWKYIQYANVNDEYFDNEREILLDLNDVWCQHSSCGALKIGRYKYIRGNNIASLLPEYDGSDWDRSFVLNADKAEAFCNKHMDIFSDFHGVILKKNDIINSVGCQNTNRGCLFDLKLDPCEYYDLSEIYPELLKKFQMRLDEFEDESAPALMGENNENEIVRKEIINPRSVCQNPMFWCPYEQYKDVEWEYTLFEDSNSWYGNIMDDNGVNLVIYMCLWFAMCVGLFVVCKHERNKKNGYFVNQEHLNERVHELQPLVVH